MLRSTRAGISISPTSLMASFVKATPITTTDVISAVNAASFTPTVSPGALLTLYGANLAANPNSPSAPLQASVGDTSVNINNLPTPLLYVSPSQINLQIPFDAPLGTDTLTVSRTSTGSVATQVTIAAASPAIFRLQNGPALNQDQGAIVDLDGSVASPFTNGAVGGVPAVRGSYVSIYCTGLGDVTNRPANGAPAATGLPLFRNAGDAHGDHRRRTGHGQLLRLGAELRRTVSGERAGAPPMRLPAPSQ